MTPWLIEMSSRIGIDITECTATSACAGFGEAAETDSVITFLSTRTAGTSRPSEIVLFKSSGALLSRVCGGRARP